jgi:3-phenylpropionate/trans-cinnamate dioxygenase ferredoxin reductase component
VEHTYDYLIIGGGMAADAAAKSIRKHDDKGTIGLVGSEINPPYERPPLTKSLWTKDKPLESVDLDTQRAGVDLHLGRTVLQLDCAAKVAIDDHSDRYRYGKLLIATGARPHTLPFDGNRVINYRTVDDYRALRDFARPGARIAVVGGGFIGGELAASLTTVGCKVTMLFPGEAIGAGRYPPALSNFLNEYFRDRGVELRTEVRVVDGRTKDEGVELALSDGANLSFDGVVAGLGVMPNTELAATAGLRVTDGVVVDELLRTSDPSIWAAGDVANFHHVGLNRAMRVEHESAAVGMGHHAGRAMTGVDDPYDVQPFVYSDLFDLGYEAVGLLDAKLDIVEDWTQPFREGVVYYLDDGYLRGVLLWNVWGQVDAARELVLEKRRHDADSLRGRLPKLA